MADILTDGGWLNGTFQVPAHQSLMDFFAGGVPLLKTTRVRFPGERELFPFIALRREAIHLLDAASDDRIEAPGSGGHTTPHQVEVFLLAGLLRGTLEVLVNVRLSDFLRQQTGLLVLRDCLLVPYGEPRESPKARKMRTVLLSMGRILGVGEPINPVQPGAR
ncbi:MAG TPA: hypothetical protein VEB59_09165 [Gemmatimonadales bacterium]|nr:hypothetical protein [Gemmatimonadales bacterium]